MAVLLAQLPGPIRLVLKTNDLKFADILHDLITAKGNRSGVPRVLAVDRNEPRELAGTVKITGVSKDDAITQIRSINALVTVGTTLTLQSTGATYPVTLKILPSRGVSQPLDELFEIDGGPVLASCAFSFTCEPYAYGPEVIVANAAYSAPCMVHIDVPGDYPTPLSILWRPTSRAGVIDRCAMGLLPDQTAALGALLHNSRWGTVDIAPGNPAVCTVNTTEDLFTGQTIRILDTATTPATASTNQSITVTDERHFSIPVNITSGGSGAFSPWYNADVGGVGDAAAYGGEYMSYADAPWALWQVNDTGLPRGTYLPFLRVGKTTSGAAPYVYLSTTGQLAEHGFISAYTGYEFYKWPQSVAAPAFRVLDRLFGVSRFVVGMRAGPGGGAAQFDYLAMLPTSWGWLIQNADAPLAAETLFLDYDGTCYADGLTQSSGISTGGMSAVGLQSILFLAAPEMGAAESTITGTLTIAAIPRHNLWR